MQQTQIAISNTYSRGGGRIASEQYCNSVELCQEFTGLQEDTSRYDLLLLVKRVGKFGSFTPRMIQLLDYYMAFTTERDWEQGSRPIVFQSLSRTAMDLGVTERQIQKLEKQLFEAGAITWNDSGNHKRYGQRERATGRLLYAYGVDLTPLAFLRPELDAKLQEKQLYAEAWQATKREISWYRRQIRSLLLEWQTEAGVGSEQTDVFRHQYERIAVQLRSHIPLKELRSLLERHRALCGKLKQARGVVGGNREIKSAARKLPTKNASKSTCRSDTKFAHKQYTNLNKKYCSPVQPAERQEFRSRPSAHDDLKLSAGLQQISSKHVLLAASECFRDRLPIGQGRTNWSHLVTAAYQLGKEMKISQQSWSQACEVLGREGAATAVVIADRFAQRLHDPVRNTAAYFGGMVNKAYAGTLRLDRSIFGLVSP